MPDVDELPIPEAVLAAKVKYEMARIWLADGDQIAVISPRMWEDPAAWGLMLVDLAKHVADAYRARGYEPAISLSRIKAAMDAEWSSPTE